MARNIVTSLKATTIRTRARHQLHGFVLKVIFSNHKKVLALKYVTLFNYLGIRHVHHVRWVQSMLCGILQICRRGFIHTYFRIRHRENSLRIKCWARFLVGEDYSIKVRAHFQVSNWNFNSALEQLSQSGVISVRSLSNFIFHSDPDRNIINHKGPK